VPTSSSKPVNALDILAREVRTKIIKGDEASMETILKLKVEGKRKQLKSKLIKLNEVKALRESKMADTEVGDPTKRSKMTLAVPSDEEGRAPEFRKQKKSKEYRRTANNTVDKDDVDQANSLLLALRKKLEMRRMARKEAHTSPNRTKKRKRPTKRRSRSSSSSSGSSSSSSGSSKGRSRSRSRSRSHGRRRSVNRSSRPAKEKPKRGETTGTEAKRKSSLSELIRKKVTVK